MGADSDEVIFEPRPDGRGFFWATRLAVFLRFFRSAFIPGLKARISAEF
jgi:hypothetical protein